MKLFSGSSSVVLANLIAEKLYLKLTDCKLTRFSDGEVNVNISETVRGDDCFIIQSTCNPVNEHIMELLIIVDALKRASAKSVNVVIPYYGYCRQDRKAQPRQPISAKLVANLITTAGADRIATIDLHADQIQGFFDIPLDHLYAKHVIFNYINNELMNEDLVIVSPDAGSAVRVYNLAKKINHPMAMIDKRRVKPNEIESMNLIGDVKGKTAFIIDDIIDTGGTLCKAGELLREMGAKKVYAFATHGVLSGKAYERLLGPNSPFEKVLITNTIPTNIELVEDYTKKYGSKLEVLDVSPLFSEVIKRICSHTSVSSLFV
jgi:ribose-phosphate pyrophosphokinase